MGLMDNDPDMWAVEARFKGKKQEPEKPKEQAPKRGPGDHVTESNDDMQVYGY